MTSRGPLSLAALASAAVPGLDPSSVEGVIGTGAAHPFDVAFVQDHEHRRWVIRSPRTPAASAQLEQSAALLALLTRRLKMPVPTVKGWVALPEGGRAAVHAYLTGRLVDLASITPGSKLAAGLGRALAQLHNLDRQVYEEAGTPVYEAEAYRTRRLAELDRAAATGRVPTGLLTRWEHTLEDVSLWRFTTTPTHGSIGPSTVLATPDDGGEPDVKSLLGWESAQVADPADDLALLVAELHPETLDTVLEAYAHARADRPDRHLQRRARLVQEMQLVRTMMSAVAAGDDAGAEDLATELRRLDERVTAEDEAAERSRAAAAPETTDDTTTEVTTRSPQSATTDGSDDASGATPSALDDPTATASTDADDAVEVEDTAAPTPVRSEEQPSQEQESEEQPSQEQESAEAVDTSEGQDVDGASAGPRRTETASIAPADATGDADASDDTEAEDDSARPTTPAGRPSRDHETAEIIPLTGDEGDDVLPPSPRR